MISPTYGFQCDIWDHMGAQLGTQLGYRFVWLFHEGPQYVRHSSTHIWKTCFRRLRATEYAKLKSCLKSVEPLSGKPSQNHLTGPATKALVAPNLHRMEYFSPWRTMLFRATPLLHTMQVKSYAYLRAWTCHYLITHRIHVCYIW